MVHDIRLADLGFFAILASTSSLSAAARELGITTSAVSRRLAQIESRLGVPLLARTTRQMRLTEAGKVYLKHARRIGAEIDVMARALGVSGAASTGCCD